ncbi:hypothetical protein LPY66_15295 [Dehalobacter sp. DCM]|uniref:hypothetical protein n=1 Tax=Dehalobacter sp. DCM TaxID=2907827 RepID=UPI00308175B9|nr:hypothetical protein LPY66_15295 [Dehalobacter sp. DCM]
MERKTVLINASYLVEIDEAEINKDNGQFEQIENLISKDIMFEDRVLVEWESTSSIVLDPSTLNCGRCSKCNRWVTDREKLDAITQLCNGATVDGQLLCDDCLPPDHKWAF